MKKIAVVVLFLCFFAFFGAFGYGVMANENNSATPPAGPAGQGDPLLQGTGGDKLIIQDNDPWGYAANQQVITYLGYGYTIVSSTDFVTTDLTGIKVIIISGDQTNQTYFNLQQVPQKVKLESFVQSGGILIAHMCDWGYLDGIWNFSFLPCAPSLGHVLYDSIVDFMNDLTIVDSSHPIINGVNGTVTDAQLDGNNFSAHGYFTNLPPNAQIIIGNASDPTGQPTYVVWECGKGTVIASMQTMEWTYSYKVKTILLTNEIAYAQSLVAPPPVGGEVLALDNLSLIAPYIVLTLLLAITTASAVVLTKRYP